MILKIYNFIAVIFFLAVIIFSGYLSKFWELQIRKQIQNL